MLQCFVVATLASVTPAVPFVFRNYEYSPESQPPRPEAPGNDEASLYELGGSSKHLVWQAVRASSAAPYYLDDFVCGQDRQVSLFKMGRSDLHCCCDHCLAATSRL